MTRIRAAPELRRESDGKPTAEIPLRPHHLLCALGFAGYGYSDAFTANMARLVLPMRAEDATPLRLVAGLDPICAPCPERRGAACAKQPKIERLDRAHAAALGLAPGDRLTWGEARERIRARVRPADLAILCADCRWLHLGLCERALSALHETQNAAPKGGARGSR